MNRNFKVKQRDLTDCGAACLASISNYYGAKLSIAKIRQLASTDKKGTNLLGLIEAANKIGFDAKGVKGDITALPEAPVPAIAHVIIKALHHYVVVVKIEKDTVTIMDPAHGDFEKLSFEKFSEIWSGVLLLLTPSDTFQKKEEVVSVGSRLFTLCRPHSKLLFQAFLGALLFTVLGLSTSIYVQKIVDYVLVDRNINLLHLLSGGMLVILGFQTVFGVVKSQIVLRTGQMIDARLILGYYQHLLHLPQRFFDNMRVGEIVSRINDAVKIRAFINDVFIGVVLNVCILVFSFALMFLYSWKLALVMLTIIPIYGLLYFLVNVRNKKYQRKLMEASAELESQLVESLNSIGTIKRLGLEKFTNLKTEIRFVEALKQIFTNTQTGIISENTSGFLSTLFIIVLFSIGATLVLKNEMTPGELLSFHALLAYLTGPVSSLVGMNAQWQSARIAADRLFELMDLEQEASEESHVNISKLAIGDISFQNVAFRYGSRVDVFQDFNLTIPAGKLTAIVGESGSGKSTLASLVQKVYPLNGGEIFIGDHNIQYVSINSLREVIGVVPQNIDLFSGNVMENIAIGDMKPDFQKIIRICKTIGILDFIESLPEGFQSPLGENGAMLSGGQKQRLAIARALYREPKILILDEATSSLDTRAERYIQNTILELKNQGVTVIIIAHRLSTAQEADNIVVLEKGKVIENGTHFELLEQQGKYEALWKAQSLKV